MDAATRDLLLSRAKHRCEYCHAPLQLLFTGLHVDHIRARQHGGTDDLDNLAMACPRCNASKGPNIAGIDPDTGQIVPLFNPRYQPWVDHFIRVGPRIEGLSPTGRATITVLQINQPNALTQRLLAARLNLPFEDD